VAEGHAQVVALLVVVMRDVLHWAVFPVPRATLAITPDMFVRARSAQVAARLRTKEKNEGNRLKNTVRRRFLPPNLILHSTNITSVLLPRIHKQSIRFCGL